MMHVKRRSILLLAVCALFASAAIPAFAGDTRMETMGAVNAVARDDFNIWSYPSTIVRYPNLATLGLGGQILRLSDSFTGGTTIPFEVPGTPFSLSSGLYGGATVGLGHDRVLGVFASEASDDFGVAPIDAGQRFDVLFGMKRDGMDIGLRVSRMAALEKETDSAIPASASANYERSVGLWNFQAGVGTEIELGKVEAAINFGMLSFTNEAAGNKVSEPDGNKVLGARARLFHELNERVVVVPSVEFTRLKTGAKRFDSTGKEIGSGEDASSTLALGSRILFEPQPDYLLVGQVFYSGVSGTEESRSPSDTSKTETSITILPGASVGIEAKMLGWLQVRFGVVKWLGKAKAESGTRSREGTVGPFDWVLGFGIHIGNLTIDVGMDRELIRRGPYILSGASGLMFPKATLQYNFQEE